MRKTYILGFILFFSITLSMISGQGCKNNGRQPVQHTDFEFKEKLSDYGFFKGPLTALHPNEGVLHYDISTALFTDYALKDRFIVLPKGTAMKYTSNGPLDFPDSTIIVKNFAYTNINHEKIMIETRLMFKDPEDKKWKMMNYLWNKEQTDAIKHIRGAKVPITLLDDKGNKMLTNYQVPNTNDCKRCHIKDDVLIPIGPKARNLNITVAGQKENQLKVWAAKGVLKDLPDTGVAELPNWTNVKSFNLNQRARAYLDVNCAHCHTKGGDAYNTGLFLEYEQTDPARLGINKVPVSAGGGAGGLDYDIIPGDAEHSILHYRMNSNEPGTAMPELARTITHKEGVQLIREWINSMKK
jgi:uncharacterized repeat protein (TIGR03806 family)